MARRQSCFYWVTIMFSQTLGTALGDWTADTNDLGYLGAAAVFGALLLLVLGLYLFTAHFPHRAVLVGVRAHRGHSVRWSATSSTSRLRTGGWPEPLHGDRRAVHRHRRTDRVAATAPAQRAH